MFEFELLADSCTDDHRPEVYHQFTHHYSHRLLKYRITVHKTSNCSSMASASLSPKPRAADLSRFPVSISPSQESDVPTLAHIAATSMAVDLLHRAMYPSNNPLDVTPQQTNQERELRRSLKNPDARVFQAVDVETGEIVGYAMFRFEGKEDAEENGGADSKPALPTAVTSTSDVAKTVDSQAASVTTTPPGGFSPGTNLELMSTLMKEVKAVHARVLGSKRHVCQYQSLLSSSLALFYESGCLWLHLIFSYLVFLLAHTASVPQTYWNRVDKSYGSAVVPEDGDWNGPDAARFR